MNPPLRAKDDKEALIEGLLDGTIDFIATDHAPHTEEEKAHGLEQAPFGIVGLETSFSLLYTHFVKSGEMSLEQLINYLSVKPAKRFDLPLGETIVGGLADFTVLDLDILAKINKEEFVSKGKNTPFDGWVVTGKPVMTIVNGEVVYQELS